MIESLFDAGLDALMDCLRLLPFLFLTYLGMELLEAHEGAKLENIIRRAGRSGPIWGAVLGVAPQCGFSAAASSMYAGRVITVGTLIAVFFSTSDEMLPIFISEAVAPLTIIKVLLCKVIIGIISGYLVQFLFRKWFHRERAEMDIHTVCEHEHCSCHDGVLKSAIKHTVKIAFFILLFSVALNILVECIGEETISAWMTGIPVLGVVAAAILGLVPNCAASVLITKLYLSGLISSGAMIGGLLVGAGVGLLVLFRLNQDRKENLMLVGIMLFLGVFWGSLVDLLGIVF